MIPYLSLKMAGFKVYLREAVVGSQEGAKACQDYGKALGSKLVR